MEPLLSEREEAQGTTTVAFLGDTPSAEAGATCRDLYEAGEVEEHMNRNWGGYLKKKWPGRIGSGEPILTLLMLVREKGWMYILGQLSLPAPLVLPGWSISAPCTHTTFKDLSVVNS